MPSLYGVLWFCFAQTVFEVEANVEPARDQVWVTLHKPAALQYTIYNISPLGPQETQFGTTSPESPPPSMEYRLGYEVCVDKKVWSLQEVGHGVVDIPAPQQSVRVSVGVVPNGSGIVAVPELILRWVPAEQKSGTEGCVLTGAQVYNVCHSQTVPVQTSPSTGR